LEPTQRFKNEGVMYATSNDRKKLVVGDFTTWNDKTWKVFAMSPTGLLTLQNTRSGQIPASIVLTPSQARELVPLIRVIKT
jgi:hypothetical protein